METKEPFVVIWRTQTQTSVKVRNECFKRVRVHHPNALVFVVWEEGVIDFSFVDERCSVCEQVCGSDYEAWKLFYEKRVGDSGLLLRDNLFVGSKPFPPFMANQFFWTQTDLPGLFELNTNGNTVRLEIPTYIFIGYLRRSCLSDHFFRVGPQGLSYGLKNVVSVTFPNERPLERVCDFIDDLVRLDLPVTCLVTPA